VPAAHAQVAAAGLQTAKAQQTNKCQPAPKKLQQIGVPPAPCSSLLPVLQLMLNQVVQLRALIHGASADQHWLLLLLRPEQQLEQLHIAAL